MSNTDALTTDPDLWQGMLVSAGKPRVEFFFKVFFQLYIFPHKN